MEMFPLKMLSEEQKQKYEAALEELKLRWEVDMERIKKEGRLNLIGNQYRKSIDYSSVTTEESI